MAQRPEILFPLFKPVTTLSGVGPKIGALMAKVTGERIIDLCWHLPAGLIDRRFAPKVAEAPEGSIATLTVHVDAHAPSPNRRLPYKVRCSDETGFITLTFFNARADYLKAQLPEGETRIVSGRIERYGAERQMPHPDWIAKPEDAHEVIGVEPTYPLTAGLTSKPLLKAIHAALRQVPDLPEWQDEAMRAHHNWPLWREALFAAHKPEELVDLDPNAVARQRLAYDELLSNQLALALVRQRTHRTRGEPLEGTGVLRDAVTQELPFSLTNAQELALGEIAADLASPHRMLRLLQGDVGSGKTVVALMAMLIAVESGRQAALMAPTELLARQHLRVLEALAAPSGVRIALLTGREKGKARDQLLADLADGTTQIAIGTHALFQEGVTFKNLGLAIIDEQHRFGVHQRLALASKATASSGDTNTLLMTATPIPRTLALTAYGDMDVSRLLEKPPGRQPVDTRTIPLARLTEVIESMRRAIETGARIYWVCPLVAESELIDVAAAEDRAADLRRRFGDRVGLAHGQMKGAERDDVMAQFAAGDLDILVATTVIEVGVDVPEATVMVIEHAERFGLAQLHQLRGRVGRGTGQSTCLLLYAQPLGETAQARLAIMRETDDGFRIAEEDLRLRGAGEVLGTRQSGLPDFRLADIEVHQDLLQAASDDAQSILETDPELKGPRGAALRILLYLFERDAAVRYLRSG
ncbi:MAG: ATP-dependent DNA helicase RecG [Proteobacteria bacterium]|nr:ATP-dependent DNA helicase RecG [Pseudomonadota bacterium]MDA1059585.1 ATP-dependent DNA helicase RecG [Pseudomonadota bacterium]